MTDYNGAEYARRLRRLPAKVKGPAQDLLNDIANQLMDMQRAALRRQLQPPEETGLLEASIRKEKGKSPLWFFVKAGGPTTTSKGYDRAMAFEFGTTKQRSRPFFWPAVRVMKARMETGQTQAMDLFHSKFVSFAERALND